MKVTLRNKAADKENLIKRALNIKFLTGLVSKQIKDCLQPKAPMKSITYTQPSTSITNSNILDLTKQSLQTSASSSLSTRHHSAEKQRRVTISNPEQHTVLRQHLTHLAAQTGPYNIKWRTGSTSPISKTMRVILGEWLMQLALELELSRDAVYNSMHYTDKYVSLVHVPKNQYQSVGLCALFVASKLELASHPSVVTFVEAMGGTVTREQLVALERDLMMKLRFRLNPPTLSQYMVLIVSMFNNYMQRTNNEGMKIHNNSRTYKDIFWMLDGIHLQNQFRNFHNKEKVCLTILYLALKKQRSRTTLARKKLYLDLQALRQYNQLQKLFDTFLIKVVQVFKRLTDLHDCIMFYRRWVRHDRVEASAEEEIRQLKKVVLC